MREYPYDPGQFFDPKERGSVFEYNSDAGSMLVHVDKLKRLIVESGLSRIRVHITQEIADFHRENNSVNMDHVARLTKDDCSKPIIMCESPFDGSSKCFDGAHRIVRAAQLGMPYLSGYLIPHDIWPRAILRVDLTPEFQLIKDIAEGLAL